MRIFSMQHMPLANAYLCQDCSCVGNCAEQCPACASEALMALAKVLNRPSGEHIRRDYSSVSMASVSVPGVTRQSASVLAAWRAKALNFQSV